MNATRARLGGRELRARFRNDVNRDYVNYVVSRALR